MRQTQKRSQWGLISTLAAMVAGVGCTLACTAVLAADAGRPDGKPQRIVSLNLCVDQIVLDLVPRERIRALSFLASDPSMSLLHREAQGIPAIQGTAEEVLKYEPDLVLAGEYTTPATIDLLRRLGQRVEVVPMATTFEGVRDVVRRVAVLTGETGEGERQIAAFDRRLEAVRIAIESRSQPRAIAYQVNSLASGPGTLIDEVMRSAGLFNMAETARLGPGGRMPIETMLADPPDVIVMANSARDFRTVLGDNLRHPAFRALQRERLSMTMPMAEWLCGTPHIVKAVERLAGTHDELRLRAEAP